MTTVSEKLKEVGYRTAHVGKWDVGMAHHSLTPEGRGFDTALSFFTHGPDYYTHEKGSCPGYGEMRDLWHNGAPGNITGEYAEDIFKREALRVINAHAGSDPLYLNYNLHIPHLPAQITNEYNMR